LSLAVVDDASELDERMAYTVEHYFDWFSGDSVTAHSMMLKDLHYQLDSIHTDLCRPGIVDPRKGRTPLLFSIANVESTIEIPVYDQERANTDGRIRSSDQQIS
jgi:hypothetical protein